MKKILISCIAALAFMSSFASDHLENQEPQDSTVYLRAQKKKTLKNIISLHPFQLIDGTVALGYELAIDKKNSARIIVGASTVDQSSFYDSGISNFNQFYVEGNFKFFFKTETNYAPIGFFAAPFLSYRAGKYDYDVPLLATPESDLTISSIGGGVVVGYTWLFFDAMTVEVNGGVGQQFVSGNNRTGKGEFELIDGSKVRPFDNGMFFKRGPVFKLGLSVGVNF